MSNLFKQLNNLKKNVKTEIKLKDNEMPSILYNRKDASSIPLIDIQNNAEHSFYKLWNIVPELNIYNEFLFERDFEVFDREKLVDEENKEIKFNIKKILFLLSTNFLNFHTLNVFEFLIRGYDIHKFEQNELIEILISYHSSGKYIKLLQNIDLRNNNLWGFLDETVRNGKWISKEFLSKNISKNLVLLERIISSVKEYNSMNNKQINIDENCNLIKSKIYLNQKLLGILLVDIMELILKNQKYFNTFYSIIINYLNYLLELKDLEQITFLTVYLIKYGCINNEIINILIEDMISVCDDSNYENILKLIIFSYQTKNFNLDLNIIKWILTNKTNILMDLSKKYYIINLVKELFKYLFESYSEISSEIQQIYINLLLNLQSSEKFLNKINVRKEFIKYILNNIDYNNLIQVKLFLNILKNGLFEIIHEEISFYLVYIKEKKIENLEILLKVFEDCFGKNLLFSFINLNNAKISNNLMLIEGLNSDEKDIKLETVKYLIENLDISNFNENYKKVLNSFFTNIILNDNDIEILDFLFNNDIIVKYLKNNINNLETLVYNKILYYIKQNIYTISFKYLIKICSYNNIHLYNNIYELINSNMNLKSKNTINLLVESIQINKNLEFLIEVFNSHNNLIIGGLIPKIIKLIEKNNDESSIKIIEFYEKIKKWIFENSKFSCFKERFINNVIEIIKKKINNKDYKFMFKLINLITYNNKIYDNLISYDIIKGFLNYLYYSENIDKSELENFNRLVKNLHIFNDIKTDDEFLILNLKLLISSLYRKNFDIPELIISIYTLNKNIRKDKNLLNSTIYPIFNCILKNVYPNSLMVINNKNNLINIVLNKLRKFENFNPEIYENYLKLVYDENTNKLNDIEFYLNNYLIDLIIISEKNYSNEITNVFKLNYIENKCENMLENIDYFNFIPKLINYFSTGKNSNQENLNYMVNEMLKTKGKLIICKYYKIFFNNLDINMKTKLLNSYYNKFDREFYENYMELNDYFYYFILFSLDNKLDTNKYFEFLKHLKTKINFVEKNHQNILLIIQINLLLIYQFEKINKYFKNINYLEYVFIDLLVLNFDIINKNKNINISNKIKEGEVDQSGILEFINYFNKNNVDINNLIDFIKVYDINNNIFIKQNNLFNQNFVDLIQNNLSIKAENYIKNQIALIMKENNEEDNNEDNSEIFKYLDLFNNFINYIPFVYNNFVKKFVVSIKNFSKNFKNSLSDNNTLSKDNFINIISDNDIFNEDSKVILITKIDSFINKLHFNFIKSLKFSKNKKKMEIVSYVILSWFDYLEYHTGPGFLKRIDVIINSKKNLNLEKLNPLKDKDIIKSFDIVLELTDNIFFGSDKIILFTLVMTHYLKYINNTNEINKLHNDYLIWYLLKLLSYSRKEHSIDIEILNLIKNIFKVIILSSFSKNFKMEENNLDIVFLKTFINNIENYWEFDKNNYKKKIILIYISWVIRSLTYKTFISKLGITLSIEFEKIKNSKNVSINYGNNFSDFFKYFSIFKYKMDKITNEKHADKSKSSLFWKKVSKNSNEIQLIIEKLFSSELLSYSLLNIISNIKQQVIDKRDLNIKTIDNLLNIINFKFDNGTPSNLLKVNSTLIINSIINNSNIKIKDHTKLFQNLFFLFYKIINLDTDILNDFIANNYLEKVLKLIDLSNNPNLIVTGIYSLTPLLAFRNKNILKNYKKWNIIVFNLLDNLLENESICKKINKDTILLLLKNIVEIFNNTYYIIQPYIYEYFIKISGLRKIFKNLINNNFFKELISKIDLRDCILPINNILKECNSSNNHELFEFISLICKNLLENFDSTLFNDKHKELFEIIFNSFEIWANQKFNYEIMENWSQVFITFSVKSSGNILENYFKQLIDWALFNKEYSTKTNINKAILLIKIFNELVNVIQNYSVQFYSLFMNFYYSFLDYICLNIMNKQEIELFKLILQNLNLLFLYDKQEYVENKEFDKIEIYVNKILLNPNLNKDKIFKIYFYPLIRNLYNLISNDFKLKNLFIKMLNNLNNENDSIRINNLTSVLNIIESIKERFVIFIGDLIPFLKEILDDENEDIRKLSILISKKCEEITGEAIEDYLEN